MGAGFIRKTCLIMELKNGDLLTLLQYQVAHLKQQSGKWGSSFSTLIAQSTTAIKCSNTWGLLSPFSTASNYGLKGAAGWIWLCFLEKSSSSSVYQMGSLEFNQGKKKVKRERI